MSCPTKITRQPTPSPEEIAAMETEMADIEAQMTELYGAGNIPCAECATVYALAENRRCPACSAEIPK